MVISDSIYAPFVLLVLSLVFLAFLCGARSNRTRKIAFVCTGLSILLGLSISLFWEWLLKDGLGPQSVETFGLAAWLVFFKGACLPIFLFGIVGVSAYFANRKAIRRVGQLG
jgi:hypothetical protein